MPSSIDYLVSDQIATITLVRPPVNALDLPAIRDLIAALRRAADDEDVRAVVVASGIPKRFCAGLDLGEMRGRSIPQVHDVLSSLYVDLHRAQAALGKPSIAAVAGAARGAGMTVAISCDVILCAESATFGYPEIDVGLIPGIHFAHLPRIVGKHRAFELLFSARIFDAAEAASLGLVSRVLPDAGLLDEARRLARVFAQKPPGVMKMAKAAFVRANDQGYSDAVANVVDTFCAIAATADAAEGLQAFAEKRKPRWAQPG